MEARNTKIIPSRYIPPVESYTQKADGKDYLIANDAMYTFYMRTRGEFSDFFLALKDEKRLLGCRCPECGLVRVPPFLTHCPDCNFAPTESIEVDQIGIMNSTPPITYFATSLFQHMAPYGRGRVIFRGADTAISVLLYTTTGILVPGMVNKGTEVKLVFKDGRIGAMTDVFCVPASELPGELIRKKGLQESEIDWESPAEPELPASTKEDKAVYQGVLDELKTIVEEMNQNERARKDIAGWRRKMLVKTRGGQFIVSLDDGNIGIEEASVSPPESVPDFVMVCEDPKVLLDGLAYKGAVTDSVIHRKLWISKNMEFLTIFKLDRMARSLARSRKGA